MLVVGVGVGVGGGVGVGVGVDAAPVLLMTVPLRPQAYPVVAKLTPVRSLVVLLPSSVQVFPPFVVAMIMPPLPTAQPLLLSLNSTSLRLFVTPVVRGLQVAPPLVVRRAAPAFPTI